MSQEIFQYLYNCLQSRPRPEDVAQYILDTFGDAFEDKEKHLLIKASNNSLKNSIWGYSSMARDFARPDGAQQQITVAQKLFEVPSDLSAEDCLNPSTVEQFLLKLSSLIHASVGALNFTKNRLNRQQRKEKGLTVNHRRYNKQFRALERMEDKIRRMIKNHQKYDLSRISKSGFATKLSFEDFAKDINTACFLAYYSARMNVRSIFTDKSQERAYDEISQMLYDKAKKHTPDWWSMAHINLSSVVLSHLSERDKGRLYSDCFNSLKFIADFLKELCETTDINRETMVVQRGNDSTTWNQAAGAWNKMRDVWITLNYDLGLDEVLEAVCPGKVLRLMASDVVAWHSWGKKDPLHPDTKVWRDLPAPWEVLSGTAQCPRIMVEKICVKHDVNPNSWSRPRSEKQAVAYKPTPELVNGVAVANPYLAKLLRQNGLFSGKETSSNSELREALANVDIIRDESGAAVMVA